MDEREKKEGAAHEAGAAATSAAELEFPVTFDLKIIYTLADGGDIIAELERIYAALGVQCALIQGIAAPGAKYGRMGSRLTFQNREQMYATYEAIGKLPYVKAAI